MKKIFFLLIFSLSINLFSQTNNLDEVVYLKSGGVIRGIIIEQVPNEKLKIQTRDGNIFVYQFSEIEKITKEPSFTYNNNKVSSDLNKYKTKGVALTATGSTLFVIGFPIMMAVELISGTILTAASLPLIIMGPINLKRYHNSSNSASNNKGLFLSPSVSVHDNIGIRTQNNTKGISLGASLTYKF